MSHTHRIGCVLIALLFGTLSVAGPQGPLELAIDCDRGDSLQKAVNLLARKGGGTVRITGTCAGVHVDSPYIAIVGDSPATSRIVGGLGTAVSSSEPGRLDVGNVRLEGGQGVSAAGSQRVVFVDDCEIGAEIIDVRADAGAGVVLADSDLAGAMYGVRADGGIVVAERTVIRDSDFGARVFDGKLFLIDSEVTGSGTLGVQALDRSTVEIQGGRFSENGNSHLSVTTDSRLVVYNTVVGGPEDTTSIAIQANDGAKVGLYADDPSAQVWRIATVRDDSYLAVDGATFRGSIHLHTFSKLVLNGTVTEGIVHCDTAADAVCEYGASAVTVGCGSAPPDCMPSPDAAHRKTKPFTAPVVPWRDEGLQKRR